MTTAQVPAAIAADQWLESVLGEDAELATLAPGGVFGRGSTVQQLRNQKAVFPVVVYGKQRDPDRDNYTMDGLAWTQARWLIACIDQAEGTLRAGVIAQRIDELLNDAPLTDLSGRIMRCFRARPVDRAETAQGGLQFQHVGGVYEIWIRE
jgi:hypothetical protein